MSFQTQTTFVPSMEHKNALQIQLGMYLDSNSLNIK